MFPIQNCQGIFQLSSVLMVNDQSTELVTILSSSPRKPPTCRHMFDSQCEADAQETQCCLVIFGYSSITHHLSTLITLVYITLQFPNYQLYQLQVLVTPFLVTLVGFINSTMTNFVIQSLTYTILLSRLYPTLLVGVTATTRLLAIRITLGVTNLWGTNNSHHHLHIAMLRKSMRRSAWRWPCGWRTCHPATTVWAVGRWCCRWLMLLNIGRQLVDNALTLANDD